MPFAHHRLDLWNILDREESPESRISGTHSCPDNGYIGGKPTSYQDLEYPQPSK